MSIVNKITYIFIIGLSGFGFAQDAFFNQGNALYNDGKYQEAIQVYEKILETQKHSSEAYFNLANAYYKTNQVAPSIYYYEKALQLSPNDKDIQNNLAFAQNMTIDSIETIPEIGLSKIFNNVIDTFNFDVWSMLAVAFVILFVLLFLGYYFSFGSNKKRLMFVTSFASLFLAVVTLTFAFQKYNLAQNDKPAIVFAEESEVKTDPNLKSEKAFSLHEGTKVQVLEDFNENWLKIQLANGKTGWIPKSDIKLLNDI